MFRKLIMLVRLIPFIFLIFLIFLNVLDKNDISNDLLLIKSSLDLDPQVSHSIPITCTLILKSAALV